MGIVSSVKKKVKEGYRKVDIAVGGRLPGGVSSKPEYEVYIPSKKEIEQGYTYSPQPTSSGGGDKSTVLPSRVTSGGGGGSGGGISTTQQVSPSTTQQVSPEVQRVEQVVRQEQVNRFQQGRTGTTRFEQGLQQANRVGEERMRLLTTKGRQDFITKISPSISGRKEYYSSEIGGYVSTSPTGASATAYIRPPTPDEIKKINELTGFSAKVFGTTNKQENILTADISKLKLRQQGVVVTNKRIEDVNGRLESSEKELKEIENKIVEISKGNINKDTNEWTGSVEDYNRYEKEYQKYQDKDFKYRGDFQEYQNELERLRSLGGKETGEGISQPTIKVGLFGMTKEIPISEVTGKIPQAIILTSSATVGVGAGKGARAIGLKDEDTKRTTTQDIVIKQAKRGTMQYDNMGKGVVWTETTIQKGTQYTDFNLLKPRYIERTGEIVGGVAPYFIPYGVGTGLFVSEIGGNVQQQGFKPIEFVKQRPLETGIITLIGVTKVGRWD